MDMINTSPMGVSSNVENSELVDEAVDIIRRETDSCDCSQGFRMAQSIGSGTGMDTLLMLEVPAQVQGQAR